MRVKLVSTQRALIFLLHQKKATPYTILAQLFGEMAPPRCQAVKHGKKNWEISKKHL